MKNSQLIRKAMHAGSWYEANPQKLNEELNGYLAKADKTIAKDSRLRAIIGPHAGYKYSGPNAAWAYTNV